jgi:hypothetical protein
LKLIFLLPIQSHFVKCIHLGDAVKDFFGKIMRHGMNITTERQVGWGPLLAALAVGAWTAAGQTGSSAASTAASPAHPDMDFLRGLTRDVVAASRVPPGQKSGGSPTNSCGFTLIMPGGRGSYPAYWVRDFAMSLQSGFVTAE